MMIHSTSFFFFFLENFAKIWITLKKLNHGKGMTITQEIKHDIMTAKHDMITAKHDIMTAKHDMMTAKHDVMTATHDMITENMI